MDSPRALIRKHLSAAWPHRWVAVAASWAICIVGWAIVDIVPDRYETSARLYVEADAVLTPLLKGLAADNSPTGHLDILQRTLLSRPNLERLIAKTDLDLSASEAEARERLVEKLGRDIKVTPETKTLFTIRYRSASPKLAYDVVQTLLAIFIESATGANRSDMENARRFLDQQIASYERQLRGAEKRRADFRARYVDLLPSDGNGGESRLDLARTQLIGLRGQLEDAVQRRDALKKELSATPVNANIDAEIRDSAPSRLRTAEDQLAELRLRFTDQHPDVIAMKRLIAVLKVEPGDTGSAAKRGRIRSISNLMYEQLKVRLLDAEAQVASLQRQMADAAGERERLETMARSTPGVHAEYENLDRDYSVLRKNYEELLGRREAASIAEAADTQADKVKLQIVDPPQVPRIAVSPNRLLLIPGVLLAGLVGGGGLAFLLGQADRSFRTLDDLRVLGLPVLGGISLLDTVPRRKRLVSAFGFGVAMMLLVAACGGLVTQFLRQAALV